MNEKQKTFMAKRENTQIEWFLIDAEGKTLGRLASEIAKVLRGKHKPTFTPHADTGDGVVVINAEKVAVSGSKEKQKLYRRYTGYPGGLRETTLEVMRERKPTFIIENAVHGMMPKKSSLSRHQMRRLRIFAGTEHDMAAQQPKLVSI